MKKEDEAFEKKTSKTKSDDHTLTKEDIIAAIKEVYDPELPVNIYDLGLIYDIEIDKKNNVMISMTLTTPMCPVADILPLQVHEACDLVKGVNTVQVQLTFDPPWNPDFMSDAAKLECGFL